jgi:hypothetical protein
MEETNQINAFEWAPIQPVDVWATSFINTMDSNQDHTFWFIDDVFYYNVKSPNTDYIVNIPTNAMRKPDSDNLQFKYIIHIGIAYYLKDSPNQEIDTNFNEYNQLMQTIQECLEHFISNADNYFDIKMIHMKVDPNSTRGKLYARWWEKNLTNLSNRVGGNWRIFTDNKGIHISCF